MSNNGIKIVVQRSESMGRQDKQQQNTTIIILSPAVHQEARNWVCTIDQVYEKIGVQNGCISGTGEGLGLGGGVFETGLVVGLVIEETSEG